MKRRFSTAITLLATLVAGCAIADDAAIQSAPLPFVTADVPLKELVAQCPIVAYARADTNQPPDIPLLLAEVWKGSGEASAAGITNGMPLRLWWLGDGGPLPDGAVLFYERSVLPGSPGFRIRSKYMVRAGRIGGMTIRNFKTAYGLGVHRQLETPSKAKPPRDNIAAASPPWMSPTANSTEPKPPRDNIAAARARRSVQKAESAVRTVLAKHDFPEPMLLEGPKGAKWAVSAKPRTAGGVTVALFKIDPQGGVAVHFRTYRKAGAVWPTVGPLLRGPVRQELSKITAELRARLEGAGPDPHPIPATSAHTKGP